jgi:CheY-like chemotaxis protein
MLTSGDHPDDASRCQQLGIAGYLLKPVKQSELLEAIETALGIAQTTSAAIDAVETIPAPQRGLRILLAEDSYFNQKLAVALLERQNHSVTVANNGQEAVRALESDQFDLVLMDVQMPIMDGLATTRVIRALEERLPIREDLPRELVSDLSRRLRSGHLPIVAMTAHAMDEDRQRCLTAGMDAYITKPFQPKELSTTLRSLVAIDPFPVEGQHEQDGSTLSRTKAPNRAAIATHLQASTGLSPDQVARILTAACMSMRANLDKARKALAEDDGAALANAAHSLKGTLLQCGLARLAARAEEIDRGSRAHLVRPYGELLAELEAGLSALILDDTSSPTD